MIQINLFITFLFSFISIILGQQVDCELQIAACTIKGCIDTEQCPSEVISSLAVVCPDLNQFEDCNGDNTDNDPCSTLSICTRNDCWDSEVCMDSNVEVFAASCPDVYNLYLTLPKCGAQSTSPGTNVPTGDGNTCSGFETLCFKASQGNCYDGAACDSLFNTINILCPAISNQIKEAKDCEDIGNTGFPTSGNTGFPTSGSPTSPTTQLKSAIATLIMDENWGNDTTTLIRQLSSSSGLPQSYLSVLSSKLRNDGVTYEVKVRFSAYNGKSGIVYAKDVQTEEVDHLEKLLTSSSTSNPDTEESSSNFIGVSFIFTFLSTFLFF